MFQLSPSQFKKWRLLLLMGVLWATLTNATRANAAEAYQKRDFTLGPRLFLLDKDDTSNKSEFSPGKQIAYAINDPKDKKEIQKKKLLIIGNPGEYNFGFYAYLEDSKNIFNWLQKSVYVFATKPTGISGFDLMLPKEEPIGILNSPWIEMSKLLSRTSTRHQWKLNEGLNLIEIEIDPQNKWEEYESQPAPSQQAQKKVKLESNNKMIFAVEVVKALDFKPIPFPGPKK